MRVLSVSEFWDWHLKESPAVYILASVNQDDPYRGGLRASFHFHRLSAAPELKQLCFANDLDSLFFNGVKEVHMFDDVKRVGVVFELFCGEDGTETYRFLADKI